MFSAVWPLFHPSHVRPDIKAKSEMQIELLGATCLGALLLELLKLPSVDCATAWPRTQCIKIWVLPFYFEEIFFRVKPDFRSRFCVFSKKSLSVLYASAWMFPRYCWLHRHGNCALVWKCVIWAGRKKSNKLICHFFIPACIWEICRNKLRFKQFCIAKNIIVQLNVLNLMDYSYNLH